MGDQLHFIVPGKPTAWQRAGLNTAKGPVIYTKSESRSYQSLVREAAIAAGADKPSDAEFWLELQVEVRRPANHFTSKGALKPRYAKGNPKRRPDLSNVQKQIEDALNGVVWHDDAQITDGAQRRRWAEGGDRVLVWIRPLDGDVVGP